MATVPQFPTGTLSRSSLNTMVTELTTNIDNSNIAAGAGIDISKTDLGTFTPWAAYTPTFYKNDNTTTFTFTTTNARYTQIGKFVTVQFHFETASVSPGVNMYMTLPTSIATGVYNSNDTLLGMGTAYGSSMDATTGNPVFVQYNTSATRPRLNTFTAITFGTTLSITGTFSYEAA